MARACEQEDIQRTYSRLLQLGKTEEGKGKSPGGRSASRGGRLQIVTVEVHHFGPGRHKVLNQFLLRILAGVNFRQRPQD